MPPSALPEPSAVRRDHVVLDFAAHVMRCENCGVTSEPVVLPIDISALVERSSAFLDQHERCPPKETAYRPGAVTDPHAAEEPIKCATFGGVEIPADVRAKMDADRELAEREACAREGHTPVADGRGAPVTAFYVCARCGKIGGRIE